MKSFRYLVVCLFIVISGCTTYRPLIDTRGVDMNRFEADLADCQRYAQQVAGAGTQAAIGAAAGALLGAAIAAAAGSRYDRSASARVGAVTGAAGGAAHGADSEMNVIRRCLQGRGYSVLQ